MDFSTLAPVLYTAFAMYVVLPIAQAIMLHQQSRAARAWLFLTLGLVLPLFAYWGVFALGFNAGGWPILAAFTAAFLSPLAIFLLALKKPAR